MNTGRLAANLDATRGLVLGEAVMLALGDRIGRLDAHKLVERASKEAVRKRRERSSTCSSADATVTQHLSSEQLKQLLDPANYAG